MKSRKDNARTRELLAFCHIEKAAGTSLTHILRRIFFLRYADVRPMHSREEHYFTAADLTTVKKINPFLLGIGGHSVVPRGSLVQGSQALGFVTQLRDPVERAASNFKYRVNRLNIAEEWKTFLEHPVSRNFQVRKIAGVEDLDLAKEIISRHFLLAGTVEQFDAFLVLLARKLGMPLQRFTYRNKNVGEAGRNLEMPTEFFEQLRLRNELDQQLYDWVSTSLFSSYVAEYPGDFQRDLEEFRHLQDNAETATVKPLLDSLYRKGFMTPVSGVIRLSNGLPYQGSYGLG